MQPGRGAQNQLAPVYAWNNTMTGSSNIHTGKAVLLSENTEIVEGRDFFNDTPMPGYQPYTYPHPLIVMGFTSDAGGAVIIPPSPTPTPTITPSPTPTATPHPADTNSDYKITVNEATAYGACWRSAPSVPAGCPSGVDLATLDNAVRAGTIWNSSVDGSYHYDSTEGCPLCWVP
jgi:hypothetical protein